MVGTTHFPTALDVFPEIGPNTSEAEVGVEHDVVHENVHAAVAALQAKVGVDNSANPASVDARLVAAEGGIDVLVNLQLAHQSDPDAHGGFLASIVAGDGISVDVTDPANPVVNATGGGGGLSDAPSDGKLYGRKDGAWVEIAVAAVASPSATRWRIHITATNTSDTFFCTVAEMGLRETADGVNLATGGTPSALTYYSGLGPENAFDGGLSTIWNTLNGTSPDWLAYQLLSPAAIRSVSIQAGDSVSRALRAPKDFAVQYSTDGSAWTTAHTVTGQGAWAASETRVFTW